MPKETASRRPARSGSISVGRTKPTAVNTMALPGDPDSSDHNLPADLPALRRQPEKGTAVVPSHLALNDEERGQLQNHLDLVGVDKHRFGYSQEDQGALPILFLIRPSLTQMRIYPVRLCLSVA